MFQTESMIRYLKYIIPVSIALILCSCREKAIIPENTLAKIYYDIYMADEILRDDAVLRKKADSLKVYEPILGKYGYTVDDYLQSVNIYLERPDKFKKVFEDTKSMLEKRKSVLEKVMEVEGKWSSHWDIVDSLELYTMEGVKTSALYRCLRALFFEPDSLVPESPAIDSAFWERPANVFFLFTDSAYKSDSELDFYLTKGIPDDIKRICDTTHSPVTDNVPELKTATEEKKTFQTKLENLSRPAFKKELIVD